MLERDEADVERFLSYVLPLLNGHWLWLGARSRGAGNRAWYGSFRTRRQGVVRAHRYASEVLGGQECPAGHHRDHACCFSLCVRPEHLEVVTHAENQRRKMDRRAK